MSSELKKVIPMVDLVFETTATDIPPTRSSCQSTETVESTLSSQSSEPLDLNGSFQKEQSQQVFIGGTHEALFIGDLDFSITEEMLTKLFSRYSSFISAKVCINKFTNKSLGHGYLNFGKQIDAARAINEFNYRKLLSKEIHLMPSMRDIKSRTNSGTTVIISNVTPTDNSLTKRYLFETFRVYGEVLSCKLDDDMSVIYICFNDGKIARNVVERLDGTILFCSKISCSIFIEKYLRNRTIPLEINEKPESDNNGVILVPVKERIPPKPTSRNKSICNEDTHVKEGLSKHYFNVTVKNFPLPLPQTSIPECLSILENLHVIPKPKEFQTWLYVRHASQDERDLLVDSLHKTKFQNRLLNVYSLPVKKIDETQRKKTTVQLSNLCLICNKEFLKLVCGQEKIRYFRIEIRLQEKQTTTLTGIIECKSSKDAQRLVNFLHNKLIGGIVVQAVIQKPT